MKRYLASAAAAAFLASGGLAYAADTFEGEIVGIDHQRQMIMLDTGQEFVVSQQDLARLQPGDRVVLTYPEPHVAAAPTDPAVTPDPMATADPATGAPPGDPADERSGEIIGIDRERGTITLDTGEEFVVPERELVQLSPGQRVLIPSFEVVDGQWVADSVFELTRSSGVGEPGQPGTSPGAQPAQ